MDDQLKQSALDFHEFPVRGKIRGFSNQASGNAARSGAGLLTEALPHLVLKSKKDPLKAYKYTARGNTGGGDL